MRFDKKNMLLYAVTGGERADAMPLDVQVELAIQGGATMIQMREKGTNPKEMLREAMALQTICRKYHVPFLINDHVALAKKIHADGVHVGQNDMRADKVRQAIGRDKILGVSVQTAVQAIKAQALGADYLGVGAVFHTNSKDDADFVPMHTLQEICHATDLPVVAIGGIQKENLSALEHSGICGIAVISAIFSADDIKTAAHELKCRVSRLVTNQGT